MHTVYTVEFFGPKGWEVGKETESWAEALLYFRECMKDGYNARITAVI